MKGQYRGIIGLNRATCDAVESAIQRAAAVVYFNGYNWVGGPIGDMIPGNTPVITLTLSASFHPRVESASLKVIAGVWSGVLSQDEMIELETLLNQHAFTHDAEIHYQTS